MSGFLTQPFDIHGIGIQVDTTIPPLAAGIGGLLRRFAHPPAMDSQPLRFIYERSGKAPDPLSKVRALQALLPHSLLCFDQEVSAHRFALLARLVESTKCYRLYFGRDALNLPHLVDTLLE